MTYDVKAYQRQWYLDNQERQRAKNKEWYKKNRKRILAHDWDRQIVKKKCNQGLGLFNDDKVLLIKARTYLATA